MSTSLRDYTFLGTTESLCPECLALVPAKIVVRDRRVYFRKRCPTHGPREDFVCSDVGQFDRLEYTVPARLPQTFGTEPRRGCPYDCGLCTEHEQHTCIGLVELTSSCNLECPMCYAASGPGGVHQSVDACRRAIDRLVEVEGRPEVLQLSGGEPTIHPQFREILDHALSQPIDYVQINTNGIRLAHEPALIEALAPHRDRLEIFFQLDGFDDDVSRRLRGEALTQTKLAALEALGRADVHVTLAVTLQGGVNEDQIGQLVRFGLERPWITGINFQPATYSGRYVTPETLERRVTFPDVIGAVCQQTDGLFREDDFMPLPCAHPNCHSMAYAWRRGGEVIPLARLIDHRSNLDLLANGIVFTRPRARDLLLKFLGRLGCCGSEGCCGDDNVAAHGTGFTVGDGALPVLGDGALLADGSIDALAAALDGPAGEFIRGAVAGRLGASDVFRITITSFLDAYNFDVRRVMKCCTHHVLPSGHVIPFCAYNVLYRPGHVPLPELTREVADAVG
ncbi:MAG: radical SAM protein [Planctomycetales bacterium]|nr:radical SAM protein [Planctomycetales bacterium]